MAPRSSITKRWLLNSFGIIVVIMVAMVIGVSAAMHSFYYNSASQYIRTRAAAVSARLESAAADAGSDFNARLYELVQDFEYRDRIELMALDAEFHEVLGRIGSNPIQAALLRVISAPTLRARVWRQRLADDSCARIRREHQVILDAIRARDVEAARNAMWQHVTQVIQWVEGNPEPMSAGRAQ